jgi:hypothetical protein
MKYFISVALAIGFCVFFCTFAHAANVNSSGRCPSGTDCSLGEATTTSFTIITDGTGNSEVVLPDSSIGSLELASDSVQSTDMDDSICSTVVAVFIDPTEAGATDDYINLIDSTFNTSDAAEDEFTVSVAMYANHLRVSDVTDPGAAGDIWQITVMDDGAKTALTCDIGNGETSCTDTGEVSVGAGSDMTVMVDSGTGSTDPAASGNMRVTFCLTHD